MHHPEDVAFGFLVGSVVALTSSYVWWTAVDSLESLDTKKKQKTEGGDSGVSGGQDDHSSRGDEAV